MSATVLDESARTTLLSRLEALDGVRHALLEGPPWRVSLICDAGGRVPAVPLDLAARAVLGESGLTAQEATLEVAYLEPPPPRRRIRFVAAEVVHPRIGQAQARVRLEWEGAEHEAVQEGMGGGPAELRLVAQAALDALEGILEGRLRFRLVGAKSLRIFDDDLVVVLLHAVQGGRQFTGVSLVTQDVNAATCRAVLNATNRVLGNYLAVGE